MNRFYMVSLIVCVLIFSTNKEIVAGNWRENFNTNLDSWTKREHQRERVIWQTKNGRLNIHTKPFCNGDLNLAGLLPRETHYTLEFTAFPIEIHQFRVKMRIVNTKNSNVGIFIGEKPESLFVNPLGRTYQFVDHSIGGPLDFPKQNPKIEFKLKEIEVAFSRGLFTLYSKGEKIADFQDDNLKTINYVGIVAIPKLCSVDATAVVDDFVITDPNNSWHVSFKNKAAVAWGKLKQR